ncbi:MAG TPA: outer membrane beta-barrel protein [Rhodanobacteraceae bacterium]|nr:outer membrane beta-barrel protein [Rhodanobacteraceae bacterium]
MLKKRILDTAVLCAFSIPCAIWAADPPKSGVPTLDQVLDASGISLNGYIDAGYEYSNKEPSDRVFDNNRNSFDLHQVGLTIAKQPREGFGALVNITAGSDAQVIHSFPQEDSKFDLTQAYLQYATGALTVMGGKFTTLAGTEVIASPGNNNISRSILFGAVPFTHTGLRATYALSDKISLTGGLNNGWDQMQDANRQKTVELGVALTPIKPLAVNVSGYFGSEPTPTIASTTSAARSLVDVTATWTVSDALSFGGEYLYAKQDDAAGPGTDSAKYSGIAGYVTYMLTDMWRLAGRIEWFKDSDGAHFGNLDTRYSEGTLTLAYLPVKSTEIRGELRGDRASNAFFDDGSGNLSKTMYSVGVQGIYKF